MRKFLGASTEAAGCDGVTNTDLIVRLKTRGQSGFLQGHARLVGFEQVEIGSGIDLGIIGSCR